jgi:hypothetical protein
MKNEQDGSGDPIIDSKAPLETSAVRGRRGKRRTTSQLPTSGGPLRFFLSKPETNGVPNLDQELGSEPEAMLESLKTGRSYFVISEWKGSADLSNKVPQIRKESITAKKFG